MTFVHPFTYLTGFALQLELQRHERKEAYNLKSVIFTLKILAVLQFMYICVECGKHYLMKWSGGPMPDYTPDALVQWLLIDRRFHCHAIKKVK